MTGVVLNDPLGAPLKSATQTGMRRLLSAYPDANRLQQLAQRERLTLPVDQLRRVLAQALNAFAEQPQRADTANLLRQCNGVPITTLG